MKLIKAAAENKTPKTFNTGDKITYTQYVHDGRRTFNKTYLLEVVKVLRANIHAKDIKGNVYEIRKDDEKIS